jgi:hypothetical protein
MPIDPDDLELEISEIDTDARNNDDSNYSWYVFRMLSVIARLLVMLVRK